VKVTFLKSSVAPKATVTLERERSVTPSEEKTEEAMARNACATES
jgi:hypothetical protein